MPSAVDVEDVRAALRIESVGQDAELQDVLDAAEAHLARRVGPLASTATTSRVRPSGGVLVLPVLPAISLTSVTDADGTALTVGDLDLDTATGIVSYASGGALSSRWYTVVYAAGYATLPEDLVLAVKELTRHLWQTRRGPTRPGAQAEPNPGAAYLLPYRVQSLIEPFERTL